MSLRPKFSSRGFRTQRCPMCLLLFVFSDVDECKERAIACPGLNEACINEEGSFRCECADGFIRRDSICVENLPHCEWKKTHTHTLFHNYEIQKYSIFNFCNIEVGVTTFMKAICMLSGHYTWCILTLHPPALSYLSFQFCLDLRDLYTLCWCRLIGCLDKL